MKKQMIGILAALVIFLGVNCYAAEPVSKIKIVSTPEQDSVTIVFDETKYNTKNAKWITFLVMDENGKIVHIGERRPGAEVQPYIIYSGDAVTRTYTVVGSVEMKDGTIINNYSEPYGFTLYTYAEKLAAANDILNNGAAFETYEEVLSLDLDGLYAHINDSSAVLAQMRSLIGDSTVTPQSFLETFDRALVRTAASLNDAVMMEMLVNTYKDIIGIDTTSTEYGCFTGKLASLSKQSIVYEYMAGSGCVTENDMVEAFKAGVFLAELSTLHSDAVEQFLRNANSVYTEGAGALTLDFDDFDTRVGSNSSKKEYTISLLTGRIFDDLRTLESAFAEAVNKGALYVQPGPVVTPNGGNTSGNSGGGIPGYAISTIPSQNVPDASTNNDAFTDINEATWAKTEISYFAKMGWISGIGNGKFAPNANVTREQLVSIAVSAFGLKGTAVDVEFADVDKNQWYYEDLQTLYSLGLIDGYGETFGIGDNITREDMTVILYRIAKYKGMEFTKIREGSFTDANSISTYAKDAVNVFYDSGNINGMDDGSFAPKAHATRAQAVKMMYNLVEGK